MDGILGVILVIVLAIILLEFVVPLTTGAATFVAFFAALYAAFMGIVRGIEVTFDDTNPLVQKLYYSKKENARRSWFFGPSFAVFPAIFKEAFAIVMAFRNKINDLRDRLLGNWGESLLVKIIVWVSYGSSILFYYLLCGVLVTIFATLFSILFLAFMIVFFVLFLIVLGIDRFILLLRGYKNDCHNCNERSIIPEYVCPNCGKSHFHLAPGSFGVFNHTCVCGNIMGSTYLTGKGKYHARCPKCHSDYGTESAKPLALQLIGGSGSGKTVYLAALFRELHMHIQRNFKKNGAEYEFDQVARENLERLEDYFMGEEAEATSGRDVTFYSELIRYKGLTVPTKLEIIDIPGEMFSGQVSLNEAEHRLSQYSYVDGFLFVVDPFAEGDLRKLQSEDRNTFYSDISPEEVFTNFDAYLIAQGFAKTDKMVETPISIIITKSDTAVVRKKLDDICGEMPPEGYSSDQARDFLAGIGLANLVNAVEAKFKNVRYFIVSAIGHSPNGEEYKPVNVYESAAWLIERKEKKLFEKTMK